MTSRVAWFAVMVQLAAGVAAADPPAAAADPPAAAADPPAADPAAADPAAHLDRGVAAYRAHDFARAVGELLEANRLAPDQPDPYRWLALAEAEIDDCRSALINIDTFVARVPAGDPRVPELVALRDRCLRNGHLDVDSSPRGAAIRIDGGPTVATTPARHLALRVGPHTLILEKPGFESVSHPLDVRALGTDYATFNLTAHRDTPLVQRWWFWAAIGAVAATAVGVVYEASQGGGAAAPYLPGITCNATGCRP